MGSKSLNVVQEHFLITDDLLDDLYGGSHAWFDGLSCKSLLQIHQVRFILLIGSYVACFAGCACETSVASH